MSYRELQKSIGPIVKAKGIFMSKNQQQFHSLSDHITMTTPPKPFKAMLFALQTHAGQQRKYTSNPYSDHLAEVAGIVATVTTNYPPHLHEIMISVAWLHDCMEDQGVPLDHLARKFGDTIAKGVEWLSDMETGNRAKRKAASRHRLSLAPGWVQTIKCADLISNTKSIVLHDPKFAVTYLEEARLLLEAMKIANPFLHKQARALTTTGEMILELPIGGLVARPHNNQRRCAWQIT